MWSVLFLRISLGSMLSVLADCCKGGPNLHVHFSLAPLNVYLICIFMCRGHLSDSDVKVLSCSLFDKGRRVLPETVCYRRSDP